MEKIECKCDGCKNACKYRPGWFLPNQVNSLLGYFNVKTIEELLKTGKVAIDWWEGDDPDILILAPNIINNTEIYYPADPRNRCVFYNNELCDIHKIKPYECSMYSHEDKDDGEDRHRKIMNKWKAVGILEEFRNDIVFGSLSLFDGLMLGL